LKNIESQHQKALIEWAHRTRLPAAPDVPEGATIAKFIFSIPNGGKRSKITAAIMKAEGVKAGVSDLMLPLMRRGYAGLWLEMKAPKAKPTKSQIEWLELMEGAGYQAVWCDSWLKAADVIAFYVGVKAPGRIE